MVEQVLNQFSSERTLREDCVAIYEAIGLDLDTALRMFMERTRLVGGLPFPAILPEKRMTGTEDPWGAARQVAGTFPEDFMTDREQPSWDDVPPRVEL